MKIAIMQPYFIPYAGYFRLLAGTDLFVLYDCVQFPRRGWVHRNRILDQHGESHWITLPIQKSPQSTAIQDLKFSAPSPSWTNKISNLRGYQSETLIQKGPQEMDEQLKTIKGTPVDYIESLITQICGHLNISTPILRSSTLQIDPSLKAQNRILEICSILGAKSYLNAPGGSDLYSREGFEQRGIELDFLKPYVGSYLSIWQRLLEENKDTLKNEIIIQI